MYECINSLVLCINSLVLLVVSQLIYFYLNNE